MTKINSTEKRTRQAIVETSETLQGAVDDLSALRFGRWTGGGRTASVLETLADTAEKLSHASSRLRAIASEVAAQRDSRALDGRVEALCKWFSMSAETSAYFRDTMLFLNSRDRGESLPLGDLVSGLGWRGADDSVEDPALYRRRLEHMKDVGMLEVERNPSGWLYRISDEARDLIQQGAFRSLGIGPVSKPSVE